MTLRLLLSLGVLTTSLTAAWLLGKGLAQRPGPPRPGRRLAPELLPETARHRWAVLGFTSSLCAACQATQAIVETAFPRAEDPTFVEVDVSEHAQLTKILDVRSTPTVVLLDPRGTVVFAHEGNPEPNQLSRAMPLDPRAVPGGGAA